MTDETPSSLRIPERPEMALVLVKHTTLGKPVSWRFSTEVGVATTTAARAKATREVKAFILSMRVMRAMRASF